jgi:hypothetical protein
LISNFSSKNVDFTANVPVKWNKATPEENFNSCYWACSFKASFIKNAAYLKCFDNMTWAIICPFLNSSIILGAQRIHQWYTHGLQSMCWVWWNTCSCNSIFSCPFSDFQVSCISNMVI